MNDDNIIHHLLLNNGKCLRAEIPCFNCVMVDTCYRHYDTARDLYNVRLDICKEIVANKVIDEALSI